MQQATKICANVNCPLIYRQPLGQIVETAYYPWTIIQASRYDVSFKERRYTRAFTAQRSDRLRGEPYFRWTIKNTKANSLIESNGHSLNPTVEHTTVPSFHAFSYRLLMGLVPLSTVARVT